MAKVPLVREAVDPNSTDGEKVCKRHALTDGRGVSLSVMMGGNSLYVLEGPLLVL